MKEFGLQSQFVEAAADTRKADHCGGAAREGAP